MTNANLPKRHSDGSLPAYAWPGGYPLYYLDKCDNILCPDCANRDVDESQAVVDAGIHWEGEPLICDDCGCEIESAYGPTDDD